MDLREAYKNEARQKLQMQNINKSQQKGKYYFKQFYEEKAKKLQFYRKNYERGLNDKQNQGKLDYNLNESLGKKEYLDYMRCDYGAEENINHVVVWLYKIPGRKGNYVQKDGQSRKDYMDINKLIQLKEWEMLYTIYKYMKKMDKKI